MIIKQVVTLIYLFFLILSSFHMGAMEHEYCTIHDHITHPHETFEVNRNTSSASNPFHSKGSEDTCYLWQLAQKLFLLTFFFLLGFSFQAFSKAVPYFPPVNISISILDFAPGTSPPTF